MTACGEVLMLAGECFPCDWPTDENGRHDGWAHTSGPAEAVWGKNEATEDPQ